MSIASKTGQIFPRTPAGLITYEALTRQAYLPGPFRTLDKKYGAPSGHSSGFLIMSNPLHPL